MKHLYRSLLVSAIILTGCASKEVVVKSTSLELKPLHGGSDKGLLFKVHPECRSKYIDKRPKELHCD